MSGFCDGVSKLWILRAGRGLDVDGCKNELEAIDLLIRRSLPPFVEPQDVESVKADMRAKVTDILERALKLLDPQVRSCNRHADCDVAEAEAEARGVEPRFGKGTSRLEHCNDPDCEDCFGS